MWLKRNIVMLPTEGKANIIGNGKQLTYSHGCIASELEIVKLIGYHLHIITDEEIKEGDWFLADIRTRIDENNGKPIWELKLCTSIFNSWIGADNMENEGYNPSWSKKIIATTDTSLGLPHLSQQFIEKWINNYNKGNIITEIMVEYLLILEPGNTLNDRKYDELILKVNSNNTINTKLIKESWTRKEVVEFTTKLRWFINEEKRTIFEINKWIEENL